MSTKQQRTTKVSNLEIAGFSNVEFVSPRPGFPTQAVIFAMNIRNEKIGMARVPASKYHTSPDETVREMKQFLYEVTRWLAGAKAKQFAAEKLQRMGA